MKENTGLTAIGRIIKPFVSIKQRVHLVIKTVSEFYSVFVCSKNKSVYLRDGIMDDKILIFMLFVSAIYLYMPHVGFASTSCSKNEAWVLFIVNS